MIHLTPCKECGVDVQRFIKNRPAICFQCKKKKQAGYTLKHQLKEKEVKKNES